MTGGAIDAHFSEVIEKKGGSFNPVRTTKEAFMRGRKKRLRIELFVCEMPSVAATQCSKNIILQSNNTEANTTLHLDDIYTDMGDMGFGKRSKCLKMKL